MVTGGLKPPAPANTERASDSKGKGTICYPVPIWGNGFNAKVLVIDRHGGIMVIEYEEVPGKVSSRLEVTFVPGDVPTPLFTVTDSGRQAGKREKRS